MESSEQDTPGGYFRPDEETNLEPERVEEPEMAEEEEVMEEAADENAGSGGEIVNWEAQEYVTGEKGGWWWVGLSAIALGLMALAIFLMKSWTFAALVAVSVVALVVYIKRPPRQVHYSLGNTGLYIGDRLYSFSDYKAFGVLKDGEHFSVVLLPKKRFSQSVSVYFPEEYGEDIVDVLGGRLPMQEVKLDIIDRLIRSLKI